MPKEAKEKKTIYPSYLKKFNEGERRVSLIKLAGLNIYTPQQLKKIKYEEKYNTETIKTLYEYSHRLIAYPYDLSSDQILKMASFKGADVTIREIHNSFEKLREFGLTVTKIVNMASHDEGWNNIKKAIEKFTPKPALETPSYNHVHDLNMTDASHNPALVQNLELVQKPVVELPRNFSVYGNVFNAELTSVDDFVFAAYDPSYQIFAPAPSPLSQYQFYM